MKNIEKILKNVEKIKISKIPPVKIFVLCIPFRSQKLDFFEAVWPTDSEKPWNGAAYSSTSSGPQRRLQKKQRESGHEPGIAKNQSLGLIFGRRAL